MINCFFCNYPQNPVIKTKYGYAIFDGYPVSKGHMLIVPWRHIDNYFGLDAKEIKGLNELIFKCKELLDTKYQPDGYNIGMNCGEAAGQTLMHCHIHLIPRYVGDLENPRGGVRGVIPDKRLY